MIIPPRLHGQASWPGVLSVNAFNGTLSHGVQSGVYTLSIAPQPGVLPAANGTLAITDGANAVVLQDCRLDSLIQVRAGDSYLWQLQILDRRWKWRFGSISGTYNVRDSAGEYYPATLRSAPQLASLCFQAMGETNFDVSALPAADWPSVDWVNENPAIALNQLAELYGCRVVYVPSLNGSRDAVVICRQGVGADMPIGNVVLSSPGFDSPEAPSAFLFVAGPTRYEAMFRLEAVGEDIDGEIRPIDDLSYTPTVGWEYSIPPNFANLKLPVIDPAVSYFDTDDELMQAVQEIAGRSVYRYYRVKWTTLDGFGLQPELPIYGLVDERWQLLLEPTLIQQYVKPDGQIADRPSEVYGIAYTFSQTRVDESRDQFQNTSNFRRLDVPFSIDQERGLIIFAEPMYQNLGEGGITPADLRLLCGCQVRDRSTYQIVRHERWVDFDASAGTPPEVVSRPDVQQKWRGIYFLENFNTPDESPLWSLRTVESNSTEVQARADEAIAAARSKYEFSGIHDATYAGILPVPLDGAMRQITWSFSTTTPPQTQLSRNTEHAYWLPSYEESRRVMLTRPRPAPNGVALAADGIGRVVTGQQIAKPIQAGRGRG